MDLSFNPRSDFVKVIIDSPESIQIKETSKIAQRIKNDNNISSMFPNGCRIEVGTPGVGANLIERFQYKKNIGRKIFIEFKKDDNNVVSDTFRLIDVRKECLLLSKNKIHHVILFENIVSAKIKVSFD